MVAAGAAHALCLDDAGRVWSLGCGDDGRLGRGPDRDPAPAVVAGVADARHVAAGACHSLAATAGGRCTAGATPAPAATAAPRPEEPAPAPSPPPRGRRRGQVPLPRRRRRRSLYAFGDNSYGQLGLGGDDDAFERARPAGGRRRRRRAAGGSHSVVLLEGGDVLGFGSNADGQLGELEDVEDVESDGDGEDDGDSGDGADGASSGDDASDASDDSDGSDETAAEVWTPTRIAGLCGRGVVEVAAGGDATGDAGHTLAVTKAGAVFALGAGQHASSARASPRRRARARRHPGGRRAAAGAASLGRGRKTVEAAGPSLR
ncbi:ubiquitin-protein transferase [Aureococcus anophagefferens]|nr:ubiquitin-protein transferase [Aureococcus anophagefferens]